jgi:IS5 family transposase
MTWDTLTIHQLAQLLEERIQESVKVGVRWAEANAQARYLEKARESVLAGCMSGTGSAVQQKNDALVHEQYMQHLNGLRSAHHESEELKVRYGALKSEVEALRTLLVTKRDELRKL